MWKIQEKNPVLINNKHHYTGISYIGKLRIINKKLLELISNKSTYNTLIVLIDNFVCIVIYGFT